MSILIKGMEMPKDCIFCPMFRGAWTMCTVLNKTTSVRGRPEDCPLVPVPPHGRLIDGDVAEGIHFTDEDAEGRDFYDGILYAADFISQQPTIIEAEEGEI